MSVFDDRCKEEDEQSKNLLSVILYFITAIICIGIILELS